MHDVNISQYFDLKTFFIINISELPIIGNLHQFATKEAVENAHLVTKQWFDQYGPVIKIRQVIPSKMGDILRLLEGG